MFRRLEFVRRFGGAEPLLVWCLGRGLQPPHSRSEG